MSGFEPRSTGDRTDDEEICSLRNCLARSATSLHDLPFAVSTSAVEHPTGEDMLVAIEEDNWNGFVKREACRRI